MDPGAVWRGRLRFAVLDHTLQDFEAPRPAPSGASRLRSAASRDALSRAKRIGFAQ